MRIKTDTIDSWQTRSMTAVNRMGLQELTKSTDACRTPFGTDRPRLSHEWRTMEAMVRCYCKGLHGGGAKVCPECQGLLDYAMLRLDRCRFGEEKPTCANCPVHCYQPERRDQVKHVMRYAGPRMLWRHPLLSILHIVDGRRRKDLKV
jgi:hypothetical protein